MDVVCLANGRAARMLLRVHAVMENDPNDECLSPGKQVMFTAQGLLEVGSDGNGSLLTGRMKDSQVESGRLNRATQRAVVAPAYRRGKPG